MGARQLLPLQKVLDRLHERPAHGNRRVFDDHVLVLHLLAFFNPVVRALRMMEDLSRTPTANKLLGNLKRIPRSTLSDAHTRVDPQSLLPVLQQLMATLPQGGARGAKLGGDLRAIQQQILACDATYFQTIAELAWAIYCGKSNGKAGARVGLYVQIELANGTPFGADGVGVELATTQESEPTLAARHVVPGAIHLYDRGFVCFELLKTIFKAQADFVLRLTTQTQFTIAQERTLTQRDIAAGVISDRIGYLRGSKHSAPPEQRVREVVVANDADPDKPMRLLTSLLEPPAFQIGALYRQRWQIELFFRWLKMYGNFGHLISHNQDGAAWAFYVAAIGVTLLALMNNRRPSKYDLAMLSIVANGGATLEEIVPILEDRHRECERTRLRDAKRRQSHAKSNAPTA